jgi:5-methylcytosine-specific restriction endonuclease McrA
MLESPVLVLNRHFAALTLTDVKRCFTLFYKGHVRAVLPDYTTYGWEEWCDVPVQPDDDVITTPSLVLRIPRVIQLLSCDRPPHADVKFSRHNIYMRDGNRCQYCGKRHSTSELSLDHVTPISRGGPSNWENVVCACLSCNVRKGNRLPEEAGMRLRRSPVKPKATPLGL